MHRLLVVHHSPGDGTQSLLDAAIAGTGAEGIEGVDVVVVDALTATEDDVAAADGYLLGTPANLGYISGALKHFFDVIYNPSLDTTGGRPFGAWIHGESDTTGAALAIEKITTGLGWRQVLPIVQLVGPVDDDMRASVWELGATLGATLME